MFLVNEKKANMAGPTGPVHVTSGVLITLLRFTVSASQQFSSKEENHS